MVEGLIQVKSGIMINVGASVKIQRNIVFVKKIIYGIMLYIVAKKINIQQDLLTIQWLTKIIKQKLFQQILTLFRKGGARQKGPPY